LVREEKLQTKPKHRGNHRKDEWQRAELQRWQRTDLIPRVVVDFGAWRGVGVTG
jgi:hypothetical protein